MRDLIVQGDPTIKDLTLSHPVILSSGVIPEGTILTGKLEYHHSVLDNDPTPLKKETLLSSETQSILGMPADSSEYTATVDRAFIALNELTSSSLEVFREKIISQLPSTFQQLMTGRFTI